MQPIWTDIDRYFADLLAPSDPILDAVLLANARAGLPPYDVSRLQGKFLALLVLISGARRVLEIGTLGGYSSIWFARALPSDGRVVTLEADPRHAEVARRNLHHAGVSHRVDVRVGNAIETLPLLSAENVEPFDLVFIDADKSNNPGYLHWALKLSRPGTVIVGDNVVRNGRIVNWAANDENIQGLRRFTELLAAEPRLSATVIQTVGAKGHDGFALAVVLR